MNAFGNKDREAIIIGASPMGREKEGLIKLLNKAGYGTKVGYGTKEEKVSITCTGNCKSCSSRCGSHAGLNDIYVMAADGGLEFLLKNDMLPDFFVGDLDSFETESGLNKDEINELLKKIPHKIVPVEKDDTDMALAAQIACENGCNKIIIYGGLGGTRISHTFANVQLMADYAIKGITMLLMGNGIKAEVIYNSKKNYSAIMKGNISVISLSDVSNGVKIKGLKYEYEGNLTNTRTLGVSNSFVGKEASVSVEDGIVLLIYERK